jgi:hypothetical protein
MSVNEFIVKMAEAGFTGTFRASNGELTIRGTISEGGEIKKYRVATAAESRAKIKEMMDANKDRAKGL